MRNSALAFICSALFLAGCPGGGGGGENDAATKPDAVAQPDAAPNPDAAPHPDATADAGFAPDAIAPDAIAPDATEPDAEESDAEEGDAGQEDTGLEDSGIEDSGPPDSGDPCAPAPCFPGVTCTPNGSSFSCGPCPTGYDGDGVTCTDTDGCIGAVCFPGVACIDVPAPGTGFTCDVCPSGLEGDGVTCTEIDGCAGAPCLTGSTCTDIPAPGVGFTCTACTGPACPIFRALAGPDQEIVFGTIAELHGDAVNYNGAFTCSWTNNRDATVLSTCNATVSPSLDTIYTLVTTDASGATADDTVVISIVDFIADAGPDTNLLLGGTASLSATWTGASCADASCISCEWRLSNQMVVANTCTTTVSPSATTQYFVTVTDLGNNNTDTDSTTVYITDQPAQLCGWNVVVMTSNEYPSAPNPNYTCDPTGTARRQTINGKPAIVLSDLVVENVRITGHISVETGADDDLIGFLWGWQNPKHFYLMTWKQISQNWTANCGNAPAGIAVKKIDGAPNGPTTISFNAGFGYNATDYVYSCAVGWSQTRANAALLNDNTIFLRAPGDPGGFTGGWTDFITYRVEFYYTPVQTKVFVYADDMMTGSTANLINSFLIVDSSYPAGAFAFFSNSQEQVAFGDFHLASLDDFAANAGQDVSVGAGSSVMLSGTAQLAVPPYLCSWSDGGASPIATTCDVTVSPAVDTTYVLTVTDDFGRVQTDDVAIFVTP